MKKLLSLVLMGIFALILTGCGNNEDTQRRNTGNKSRCETGSTANTYENIFSNPSMYFITVEGIKYCLGDTVGYFLSNNWDQHGSNMSLSEPTRPHSYVMDIIHSTGGIMRIDFTDSPHMGTIPLRDNVVTHISIQRHNLQPIEFIDSIVLPFNLKFGMTVDEVVDILGASSFFTEHRDSITLTYHENENISLNEAYLKLSLAEYEGSGQYVLNAVNIWFKHRVS